MKAKILLIIFLLATTTLAVLPSNVKINSISPPIDCLKIEKMEKYADDVLINNCSFDITITPDVNREYSMGVLEKNKETSANILLFACQTNNSCFLVQNGNSIDSKGLVSEIIFTTENKSVDSSNANILFLYIFLGTFIISSVLYLIKNKESKYKTIAIIAAILIILTFLLSIISG